MTQFSQVKADCVLVQCKDLQHSENTVHGSAIVENLFYCNV